MENAVFSASNRSFSDRSPFVSRDPVPRQGGGPPGTPCSLASRSEVFTHHPHQDVREDEQEEEKPAAAVPPVRCGVKESERR